MPKGMQSQKRPGPSDKGMKIIKNWEEMYDRSTPAATLATQPGDAAKNKESAAFGGHYMKRDEMDHKMEIANMMASDARPMALTMEEVAAIERKLQQGAEMGYDGWFANTWQFESDNPVMQKWARDINPEYFRRREEQIDNMAELQKQIAKMKLYGPRSEQDLMLLYNIDTGAIHKDVLNGPLWNPQGQETAEDHYVRGLFSPIQKMKIGYDVQRVEAPWNPRNPNKAGLYTERGPRGDRRAPGNPQTHQPIGLSLASALGYIPDALSPDRLDLDPYPRPQ